MTKSNSKMQMEDTVAAWLCDAYGEDEEQLKDFRIDARDCIKFLNARGYDIKLQPTSRSQEPF